MASGKITTIEKLFNFALAGNATLTLRSKVSGQHFTYRIQLAKPSEKYPGKRWFVHYLAGPDNGSDYRYLGMIKSDHFFTATNASPAEKSAVFAAFDTVWRYAHNMVMLNKVEIWHSGRCGKCNRPLTVPESIATGLGPVCAGKLAA